LIFDPNFKSFAAWIQLQDLWSEGIRNVDSSVAGNGDVVAEVRVAGELCAYLAVARRQIEPLRAVSERSESRGDGGFPNR